VVNGTLVFRCAPNQPQMRALCTKKETTVSLEPELKELQRQLAQIDMLDAPSDGGHSGFPEFTLLKRQNLKLKMYQEKGHELPHLHVDYSSQHHVASFAIKPPHRLEGTLKKKYEKAIVDWIKVNSEKLLTIWRQLQAGGDPKDLVPQLKGSA
jgi:hypothetical protein